MISKIDFSERNLTSNSGTLMLYNHTDAEGIFEMIDEEVTFHNPSINKIKMNHIMSLLCGFFIGIDKLERMRLLYSDPLVYEMAIDVKSLETISRFLKNFDYRTTHQLWIISFKVFNHMLSKSGLLKIPSILIAVSLMWKVIKNVLPKDTIQRRKAITATISNLPFVMN